jgi:hypothetical protein
VLVDQPAQLLGARRAAAGEQAGQSVVDAPAPVDVFGGREQPAGAGQPGLDPGSAERAERRVRL